MPDIFHRGPYKAFTPNKDFVEDDILDIDLAKENAEIAEYSGSSAPTHNALLMLDKEVRAAYAALREKTKTIDAWYNKMPVDTDQHARVALYAYAMSCVRQSPSVADEIHAILVASYAKFKKNNPSYEGP